LLPATRERLRQLGERLRLARRRRRLSATQVAARAGMAPMTLRGVERGAPAATMGAYAAVMQVLGVEADLDLLAAADPIGRALQDARLSPARKAPDRVPAASDSGAPEAASTDKKPARSGAAPRLASTTPRARVASVSSAAAMKQATGASAPGFVSARALATLLDAPSQPRAKTKRR
jgi:transcriptional regulator with XRE-family HTH domain